MSIKVKYEEGIFRPLSDVKGIERGEVVEITIRKSIKNSKFVGLWKDRTDIKDGLDYVKKIRHWNRY